MANIKISALPVYTGTSSDLRWYVMNNENETTTFKFSGWTTPIVPADASNSVRSVYFASNKNLSPYGVLIGGLNTNEITSTGNYNTLIGGEGNTISVGEDNSIFGSKNSIIGTSSNYSTIIGGRTHTINNQFGFIGGGAQNTAGYLSSAIGGFNLNATNQAAIFNGENNTATGANGVIIGGVAQNNGHSMGGIFAGWQNVLDGAGNRGTIVGGIANQITGGDSNFIGGGAYQYINGSLNSVSVGGWGHFIYQNGSNQHTVGMIANQYGYFRAVAGGTNKGTFEQLFMAGSAYSEIRSDAGSPAKRSFIIGGSGATITSATGSFVLGGEDNSLTSNQSFIIASTNSDINNSSGGNAPARDGLIGSLDSTINGGSRIIGLGLSGRTFGAGKTGVTATENLYVYGQIEQQETVYDGSSSTVNIDIKESGLVELTATGGTYNIDIQPVNSNIGLELTLMIHYYSAATINFVSAGNTQWKWGNGAGAPVFSGNNNYNILVFRAWDGNDLYEQSRSMWMS